MFVDPPFHGAALRASKEAEALGHTMILSASKAAQQPSGTQQGILCLGLLMSFLTEVRGSQIHEKIDGNRW